MTQCQDLAVACAQGRERSAVALDGLLILAGLELAGTKGLDREAGLLALALLVGLLLLLVRTLRERLARLPHDPYRDVRQ